jgi:hypothetical protein
MRSNFDLDDYLQVEVSKIKKIENSIESAMFFFEEYNLITPILFSLKQLLWFIFNELRVSIL